MTSRDNIMASLRCLSRGVALMPLIYFIARRCLRSSLKRLTLGWLTFEVVRFALYVYWLWF